MGYNGIPAKTGSDFSYETVSGYGRQYSGTGGYEHKGLLTGSLVAYNREPYSIAILDTAIVAFKPETAIVSNTAISTATFTATSTSLQKAKYYEEAVVVEQAVTQNAGIFLPPGDYQASVSLNWGYLASVLYYDYKGQLIQSKSQNHLGGVEKEYIAYNFTGQPTQRKQVHSVTGQPTQTEVYTYAYDHAGRQTQTKHRLNGNAEIVLADNTYDELGRLKTTKSNNQSKLETAYRYNIRSWINSINNPLFSEYLNYTYNGNIDIMRWNQENQDKAYMFIYDNLSRLKAASFYSGFDKEFFDFNEDFGTYSTYDKHGNITALRRSGRIYPNEEYYGRIDYLTMNYGNTNQLQNINDSGENVLSNPSDFKDYKKGSEVEYAYNANGAMTQDLNKGISEIRYNRLNLPQRIDINNPVAEARNEYTYTVTGAKLRVVHRWNPAYPNSPTVGLAVNAGSLTEKKTTDYVGNKIYTNGVLEKILTENGYYENGMYYFYIRDHLGNNRIVADQTGNVEQSTQYYPFGMVMTETNREKQAFKFGGKELDMMNGLNLYEFVARGYDPVVGRFTTPDPLAEKYPGVSPYAYCMNNPLRYIDPTGMYPDSPYTYNWITGQYEDKDGNITPWSDVLKWLRGVGKFIYETVETAKTKLSLQRKALEADVTTTLDFFSGAGLEYRNFGQDTPSSESLKKSFLTTSALKKFMAAYKLDPSRKIYELGTIQFYPFAILDTDKAGPINSLWNDKGYSTAQFTGSAYYSVEVVGDHVNITVSNTTSLWSALYHLPFVGKPSRDETPLGIGGNIYQTYMFSISLDEAKQRGN
jgi:RHS repeat-associated protein